MRWVERPRVSLRSDRQCRPRPDKRDDLLQMFLDIDDEEDPDNDTHEPARGPGGRSRCPQWARPEFDDLEGRQLSSVLPETSPSAPAIATFKGNKKVAGIAPTIPGLGDAELIHAVLPSRERYRPAHSGPAGIRVEENERRAC